MKNIAEIRLLRLTEAALTALKLLNSTKLADSCTPRQIEAINKAREYLISQSSNLPEARENKTIKFD